MQIVIDIPDEKSEKLIRQMKLDRNFRECKIIELSKGHGRLIDADKTISKICGSSCGCHLEECGRDKPCYSVTRIESAPTIIEADKGVENEKM